MVSSEQEYNVEPTAAELAEESAAREERQQVAARQRHLPPANVILVGGMGAGKSTVGWHLARALGYGFIDLDRMVEIREKKTIREIFETQGEDHFRKLEAQAVERLRGLRSHVVAIGGGTAENDASWELLTSLGTTVWLSTSPSEVARRFASDSEQIRARPLLAELADMKDIEQRHRLLTERLSALIGNRAGRYKQADLSITDGFSTPESTARRIKAALVSEKHLDLPPDHRPFDRWGIL